MNLDVDLECQIMQQFDNFQLNSSDWEQISLVLWTLSAVLMVIVVTCWRREAA